MSQFDFGNLESPLSGSNFINSNLEPWRDALHTLHKGPSTPSYAVAGMMWIDASVSPWVLNIFDGTDNISVGTVNPTTNVFTPSGVSQDAEDISVDNSGFNVFTGDDVQEVLGEVDALADSLGTAAFDDTGDFATAAQGALANTALQPGAALLSITNPVATTSGTFIDLTGVSAGVNRITLVLSGVSTNGGNYLLFQLIDAGGAENTGYASYVAGFSGTSAPAGGASSTSGFLGHYNGAGAIWDGHLVFTRVPATNKWVVSGSLMNTAGPALNTIVGSKTLSATLTGVRITTSSERYI